MKNGAGSTAALPAVVLEETRKNLVWLTPVVVVVISDVVEVVVDEVGDVEVVEGTPNVVDGTADDVVVCGTPRAPAG